jgi:hypothetical protein
MKCFFIHAGECAGKKIPVMQLPVDRLTLAWVIQSGCFVDLINDDHKTDKGKKTKIGKVFF